MTTTKKADQVNINHSSQRPTRARTKLRQNKQSKKDKQLPSKFELYEASVQDAADDAEILLDLYKEIRNKRPYSLREDFCGTFKVACEWIKLHAKNTAIALDIDKPTLDYGRETHLAKLKTSQQKRLKPLQQNVLSTTTPKVDIMAACNFSYWIFKERPQLIRYFKHCYDSLKSDGLLFTDVVGGFDMMKAHMDKDTFGKGKNKFTYIWRQKYFNPINHHGLFSISFKLADGTHLKDAFLYDWRVWTIPEIRECMQEAGFQKTWVYWEGDDDEGEGNGEFHRTEWEENCETWVGYIVASKK